MRSPGNAVAFGARKNCTVAAQTRTRMERFIFSASSLYKFRLHLRRPYSSSFAKNLHFPTPHPCPLLEPAFARLQRGRRRGEGNRAELRARSGAPSQFFLLSFFGRERTKVRDCPLAGVRRRVESRSASVNVRCR